jgi:hypothetical protein
VERSSAWCLPFLAKEIEHDHGPGDRTSSGAPSARLVTVAGLCRIHTGFADPTVLIFG